jgi:formyl-CoA transferase
MKNRVANDAAMNVIVSDWIASLDYADLKRIVDEAGVPVNLVYSIADIFADPHYAERNNIVEVPYEPMGSVKMPGIVPVFSETPGEIKWAGSALGAHNAEVYGELLGLAAEELAELKQQGVI